MSWKLGMSGSIFRVPVKSFKIFKDCNFFQLHHFEKKSYQPIVLLWSQIYQKIPPWALLNINLAANILKDFSYYSIDAGILMINLSTFMGVSKHIFCFYGYKKYVYRVCPIKEPYLINLISLYIKRCFLSCLEIYPTLIYL